VIFALDYFSRGWEYDGREWECSAVMGTGGNGNDLVGMRAIGDSKSHCRTPLELNSNLYMIHCCMHEDTVIILAQ